MCSLNSLTNLINKLNILKFTKLLEDLENVEEGINIFIKKRFLLKGFHAIDKRCGLCYQKKRMKKKKFFFGIYQVR